MLPATEFSESKALALQLGIRTMAATPLMRDEEAIGVLAIRRLEAKAFSHEQIELVKTFADQAVDRHRERRLFEQVQARTADLTEALNQQTATADVLKVISRSAFDLQSVLDTLVESRRAVCEADNCVIFRRGRRVLPIAANYGFSKEFEEYGRTHPHQPGRGSVTEGRLWRTDGPYSGRSCGS